MARPLRIDIKDGWYHITNRGINRQSIFDDDRDNEHFLELLGEVHERYAVRIHGYVLMGNHYHLLIQTPEANASRALQWLNVSYSLWYNCRHYRVGPLFQGRFKSVLIEGEGSWVLEELFYLHLNPVRIKRLGLDKAGKRAEGRGLQRASPGQVQERLERLRGYRWSSYRAYAGYGAKTDWLETGELLRRSGGRERLRRRIEDYVRQGLKEAELTSLKTRLLLGSRSFIDAMKRRVKKVSKEQPERKILERHISFNRIVAVVESERGAKWEQFRNRHGDAGRDMVLYLARQRSGMTLREIGEQAVGMDYKAVGKAAGRFGQRLKTDADLQVQTTRCVRQLSNVET
jgi:putative transposase